MEQARRVAFLGVLVIGVVVGVASAGCGDGGSYSGAVET